ncbi:MAG: hypothetical protein Q8Q29_07150 [Actinomycetota bacterium]|nr:hypothetical protein [Actinomycetota bacterium]
MRALQAPRIGRLAVLALALALVGACGGTAASNPVTTSTTSTSTTSPTTTTTTTTTTTLPPTTTTTLPPAVPVVGWEGEGVREVSVTMEFDYPSWTPDLIASVHQALRQIGIDPIGGPEVMLDLQLDGSARSAQYTDLGTCYTGARITGVARLTSEGRDDLSVTVQGDVATPFLIYPGQCGEAPEESPFDDAFDVPLIEVMAALFGDASVPYLTEVVDRDPSGDLDVILASKRAALDAFHEMDRDSIPVDTTYEFLGAAIVTIYLITPDPEFGMDPASRDYERALRRVLLDYSDTDFGFTEDDSIAVWEIWLEEWYAGQTGNGP